RWPRSANDVLPQPALLLAATARRLSSSAGASSGHERNFSPLVGSIDSSARPATFISHGDAVVVRHVDRVLRATGPTHAARPRIGLGERRHELLRDLRGGVVARSAGDALPEERHLP